MPNSRHRRWSSARTAHLRGIIHFPQRHQPRNRRAKIVRSRTSAAAALAVAAAMTGLTDPTTGSHSVSAADQEVRAVYMVPLLPSAADGVRQGFVRVINRSHHAGEVHIEAFDDTGDRFGPLVLAVGAGHAVHFNSGHLENGDLGRGWPTGTGSGEGDWRLRLSSDLDIQVLSYIRVLGSGFVTSMHDIAPALDAGHDAADYAYRIATFNPGSNTDQVSRLRFVNAADKGAEISVSGIDDHGHVSAGTVGISVPAGMARTVSAKELEAGGDGMDGALGDGDGKWRLTIRSSEPVSVLSLLQSPTGHLANLSTAPVHMDDHSRPTVPFFPAASDAFGRQGFARVVNRASVPGDVELRAFDDTGREFGPITMPLGANETVHFNSNDLEFGNSTKGLSGGVGSGQGDWRLTLQSRLEIEVLAYIRTTRDGFVTSMHDTVSAQGNRHRVVFFNPASNLELHSWLRLLNAGERPAAIQITGTDDSGDSSVGQIALSVPAGGALTLTSDDLENGAAGIKGALGDGTGKWQLDVRSDEPIVAMSLLSSTAGYLTNLSTEGVAADVPIAQRPVQVRGDVRLRDPATGRTALHVAARANAPNLIAALVAAGAEVDARDKDGHTPLHEAATGNAARAIVELLAARADLHAKNHLEQTPLQHAASLASTGSYFRGRDRVYAFVPDAIAALLNAGAEPNVANATLFGATPLSWVSSAASRENTPEGLATLTLLLDAGANPNVHNHTFGTTPLQHSVDGAYTPVAAALLTSGADPDAANFEGRTALQRWASWGVSQAMLSVLTDAGADLGILDDRGATLLHLAAEQDNTLTLRALLRAGGLKVDERDEAGRTPLHAAASTTSIRRGATPAVAALAILLDAGANPHLRNDEGNTPVQSAPQEDRAMLTNLLEAHSGASVTSPNQRDTLGNTALHVAAQADVPELVDALIASGARPDVRNNDGHTPMQLAVGEGPESGVNLPPRTYSPRVVHALLSASEAPAEALLAALDHASAHIRGKASGGPPHHRALELGVVAALAQAAVDLDLFPPSRRGFFSMLALAASDPTAIRAAVRGGADPNVRDRRGEPLLHWVVGFHEPAAVAAVTALSEAGSAIDVRSPEHDWSPLGRAVFHRKPSVVRALLAGGASPNASDRFGRTPLHWAALGPATIVDMLLSAGAELELRDSRRRTALHWAAEAGNVPTIVALVRAGASLEVRDSEGLTPLQVAATQDERWRAVSVTAAALVEAGANVAVVRNDGKTLLHAAVSEGQKALSFFLRSLGTPWTGPDEAPPGTANLRLAGVEFFQGPMVSSWDAGGRASSRDPEYAVTERMHARSVLGRASTIAVRVASESPDPLAEVSVSLEDADGRFPMQADLRRQAAIADVPETAKSGLWEAEYVFGLPATWAEPGGRAIIRVDPHDGVAETDENDNSAVLTMGGHDVPVFNVTLVPVVFDGSRPVVDADRYVAVLNDLLPIARHRARVGRRLDLSGRGLGVIDVESSKRIALEELLHRWNAEARTKEYYHGLLFADGATFGFGGLGELPGNVSVGDAFDERCRPESRTCGSTIAHELGHNFGLAHAPGGCDETEPIDLEFPYPGAGIGPRRGWIATRGQFVNPSSADEHGYARHYDVMSYCHPQFISDYNYNKLVSHREDRIAAQGLARPDALPTLEFQAISPLSTSAPGWDSPTEPSERVTPYSSVAPPRTAAEKDRDGTKPSLAFSGVLDEHGRWSVTQIDASGLSPRQPPTDSQHFFALQDASQREIYREAMALRSLSHGTARRLWAVRVPMPQGLPVYIVILDAHGRPVFVEPFDLPDLEEASAAR